MLRGDDQVETTMKRITLLVASVLALVGMTSLAHAKPKLAVLGLEVIDNGAVDKRATQAAQALAAELRHQASRASGKYSLAPDSAKDLLELKMLSSCGDESRECMSEIGKELRANRLLYGKLERLSNGYQVSLKLLNTDTKEMEETTRQIIPLEELHSGEITRWSRSLYARLAGEPDAGTLTLNANVDKATIYVDGEVATTLRDGSAKVAGLEEGVHKVSIEAEGYKRYEADVAITAGASEDLSVSLIKIKSSGGGGGGDEGSSNLWKYSFYAGAVLTAGTGTLWLINGYEAGYVLGKGHLSAKEGAWDNLTTDAMYDAAGDPVNQSARIVDDINQGVPAGQKTNPDACGNTGPVGADDRGNDDFKNFNSACSQGDSAAKAALTWGIAAGVFALATGYLGYQAFYGDGSNKERMNAKGSSKDKGTKVVIVPRLTPESIGAGLGFEF